MPTLRERVVYLVIIAVTVGIGTLVGGPAVAVGGVSGVGIVVFLQWRKERRATTKT